MEQSNNRLSKQELEKRLKAGLGVYTYLEIDSTNSEAKRLLKSGAKAPFLVAAEAQTNGRGRGENSFYSPALTGVYFTLALKPDTKPEGFVRLTSCAAAAVCKAIERLTDKKPEIKWVNDIYTDGKKVCGILCESVIAAKNSGADCVIAGIGINVTTDSFPDGVENAGSLGADVDKNELIASVCNALIDELSLPFEKTTAFCRERSLVLGREISFISNGREYIGKAADINSRGELVVMLDGKTKKALTGGEIKIRNLTID